MGEIFAGKIDAVVEARPGTLEVSQGWGVCQQDVMSDEAAVMERDVPPQSRAQIGSCSLQAERDLAGNQVRVAAGGGKESS